MGEAIIGTGTLLKAGNGATPVEAFTAVAEQVTLKPPSLTRNEIDVSTHNEGEEAKILGMQRKGQMTFTCNWIPGDATHDNLTGLFADFAANTKRNWQLEFPDGTTVTFPGRVQLIDPQEITVDGPMQIACAITIDGAIVWDLAT